MVIERGEVFWAQLNGDPSDEGLRPVLIVQDDAFNRSRIPTALAVLLTSNLRLLDAPGNVLLPATQTGLDIDACANVAQLVTLERSLLRQRLGRIDARLLADIDAGLALALGRNAPNEAPATGNAPSNAG